MVWHWHRLPREAEDATSADVLGQVGRGLRPDPVDKNPAHSKGFGTRWALRFLPTTSVIVNGLPLH